MIQIYLHELAKIDGTKKYWPADFRALCAAIEHAIDPRSKPVELDEFGDKIEPPEVAEEKDAPTPPLPDWTFDRTPVSALADWCQENDEPWLEKAARFLLKHRGVRIERRHTYGTSYSWRFLDSSMPDRWKYISGEESFACLLAHLAAEIKKRIEEIV